MRFKSRPWSMHKYNIVLRPMLGLALALGGSGVAPYRAAAQVIESGAAASGGARVVAPLQGASAGIAPLSPVQQSLALPLSPEGSLSSRLAAPPPARADGPGAAAAAASASAVPLAAAAADPANSEHAAPPTVDEAKSASSLEEAASIGALHAAALTTKNIFSRKIRAAIAEEQTAAADGRDIFDGSAVNAKTPRPAPLTLAARLKSTALAPWRTVVGIKHTVQRLSSGDPRWRRYIPDDHGLVWKFRMMHLADVPLKLFSAWGWGRLIDIADQGHHVPGMLIPFIALMFSLVVNETGELVNDLVYQIKINVLSYDFHHNVRVDLFRRLLHVPEQYFHKHEDNSAEALAARINDDVGFAEEKAFDIPIRTPENVLWITGGLGMLLWSGWRMAATGAMPAPLSLGIAGILAVSMVGAGLLAAYSGRVFSKLEEENQSRSAAMYAFAQQALSNRVVYRAMGIADQAVALFQSKSENLTMLGKKINRLETKFHFVERLLGMATTELAMWIVVSTALFLLGVPTVGTIMAFTSYAAALSDGVEGIAADSAGIKIDDGGAKKIEEIRDLPLDEDAAGAVEMGPLQGRIEFRHVTFRYADGPPALDDVSFTMEPGQTVALVGASGAGKSTILKLISRLYRPESGQVLVDGLDLNAIKIDSLNRQVSLVPQDDGLLDASVRSNLQSVKIDATPEEIEEALRKAGALDFLRRKYPDNPSRGLDVSVESLSGGQRQRVAIARALMRDSNLLLLDEWTSALDFGNERRIAKMLNEMRADRTTIIVDHKMRFNKKTTILILLKEGRVVAVGKYAQLKKNPEYAEILDGADVPD
jgi:subfamily B ATP-binding cassette protein MsbA